MSVFGTFRRKKNNKKLPAMQELDIGGTPADILQSTKFSSTPNLLKIQQQQQIHAKNAEHVAGSEWSFDSGRGSINSSLGGKDATVKAPGDKRWASLRHLANVMGTLKRSKSIRKLGFGSTMNIAKSAENSPCSGKQPSESTIMALERSDQPSYTRRSSHSAEYVNDDTPDFDVSKNSQSSFRRQAYAAEKLCKRSLSNTEPGVISSGSSSETNSVHETTSIRTSSEPSDLIEDSDEESVERALKEPEDVQHTKMILVGTKKFNLDAKKGIHFLVDHGIINHTPQNVARFLKDGYGLSKAAIGDYLGERKDFNEEVLKAFVQLHDFENMNLVQALREFLWGFRLPGESQKISRMLDAFAEKYCENNPEKFSVDTCSVLCYSIIMLNTELHNPNIKDKVTLAQFIKRNRGIEGGELISTDLMVSLYYSILNEPFRFPKEDGNDLILTFFNPDNEGWLYKLSGRPKTWKRLWFILSNNCLYYFKFTADKAPKGIIPLENIRVRIPPEKPGSKLFYFILYKVSPDPRVVDPIKTCKTLSDGQTVPKQYNTIQLGTRQQSDRDTWVRAINSNNSMSRFYSDLTLKKMKAKIQNGNRRDALGVRKSQISLPSTISTERIPIPPEVIEDPSKDPQNYFSTKHIGALLNTSQLHPNSQDFSRLRSQSESRTYAAKRRINRTPSFENVSTADNTPSNIVNQRKSRQEQSNQPDFDSLERRKKLSMIEEKPNHDVIPRYNPPSNLPSTNVITQAQNPKLSAGSEASSKQKSDGVSARIAYVDSIVSHKEAVGKQVSLNQEEEKFISNTTVEFPVRIEIDCRNVNVETKFFRPKEIVDDPTEVLDIKSTTTLPDMCFESVYESNV